jgi:vacuolar-type H+-ATPase subunit I/STV1
LGNNNIKKIFIVIIIFFFFFFFHVGDLTHSALIFAVFLVCSSHENRPVLSRFYHSHVSFLA